MKRRASGFTLIELSLALAAGSVILLAIYGVFSRTIHLRNSATERTREVRVQAHAAAVLRNDLRQARFSGGTLAATLTGSAQGQSAGFPGYLKFTTTSARDEGDEFVASADLQEVSYYLTTDSAAKDSRAGLLVRTVDTSLLAPVRQTPEEQPLLAGIESMEVSFFDGTDWQNSWQATTDDPTLPEAVRVRLQPVGDPKPPVIEVLVPYSTQVAIEPATATTPPTEGGDPP